MDSSYYFTADCEKKQEKSFLESILSDWPPYAKEKRRMHITSDANMLLKNAVG
jgi:hypothetical protein